MRSSIFTLLLLLSLSAQESHQTTLSFGVEGGLDHFNSMGTNGVARIYAEWAPTKHYTLLGSLESTASYNLILLSHWQVNQPVGFDATYTLRRFPRYAISEHNLTGAIVLQHKPRAVGIRGKAGWNFRFTDFGDDTPYGQSFPTWELAMITTPAHFLNLDLVIHNYHNTMPISNGYLEMAFESRWTLSDELALHFDTGFSLSGTLSLAGYVDRIFFQLGVSYDVPNL